MHDHIKIYAIFAAQIKNLSIHLFYGNKQNVYNDQT